MLLNIRALFVLILLAFSYGANAQEQECSFERWQSIRQFSLAEVYAISSLEINPYLQYVDIGKMESCLGNHPLYSISEWGDGEKDEVLKNAEHLLKYIYIADGEITVSIQFSAIAEMHGYETYAEQWRFVSQVYALYLSGKLKLR